MTIAYLMKNTLIASQLQRAVQVREQRSDSDLALS
jgi:methylenetetrahydrofolate dehydrogenase (NADP+)/methenyltetrahydrofolate cyclohydrolase